jgi:2-polyprenyl-3-methyl-5-hydroxy-6-metoxy-1,4-benzoquinol methylase
MSATTQSQVTDVAYFESIYADAAGDAARVPWADRGPNPALVNWLNAVAPSIVRCGARVCVVGCGLGDDARELVRRGFEVTAFDCSASAIRWARSLDADGEECYYQADLFNLPARWRHRFDLVVEANTIQSLVPEMQEGAVGAMANLVSPRGHLLVICRGSDHPVGPDEGPPWALTEAQLLEWAARAGLRSDGEIASFLDDETPPVRRLRALLKRA